MSYLDKLLDISNIEWIKLGEVIKLEKGKQLNKESLSEKGRYPAYNGGVSFSGHTDSYNYNENTIIISQGGASAGFVNFITTKFYANAHCYIVLPNLEMVNNRFIYHILKLNQNKIMEKQYGAGIPALSTRDILEISIPIPCPEDPKKSLEIQSKIVHILDKFSTLTAELQAELQARKSQYEYYRNQLLNYQMKKPDQLSLCSSRSISFIQEDSNQPQQTSIPNYPTTNSVLPPHNKVEWIKLGEVIKLEKGKQLNKEFLSEKGRYPAYNGGVSFSGHTDCYNYNENTIIISQGGASAGFVNFITTKFYANAHCYIVLPNLEMVNNRFIYHILKLNQNKIMEKQYGAGIPALSTRDILEISIPIPCPEDPKKSLEIQSKIVHILDKFDTLTNSISEGLPKEIELRQKQYEYYRNMLLSFSKE